LKNAVNLSALEYQLLHSEYGHFLGRQINKFIESYELNHKVHLIASHGHTTFHVPAQKMTAQLGDGAAIAAVTELPVVSDLRAMDLALGGHGAPIVPIGEKLLLPEYDLLLNLGGIANISFRDSEVYVAYDICPANRVLNILAGKVGLEYDKDGAMASSGEVIPALLEELNEQSYYALPFPKSLANDFGTDTIYPIVERYAGSLEDKMRTYAAHIAYQVGKAAANASITSASGNRRLLVTGGGAFNTFVVSIIRERLLQENIELLVPEKDLVNYKEAMIMALMGVLRWREEYNVINTVTGASRNSIGGALWLGGEA
ncbi:MAG: anhydro-N-acetylmuramic acid kinase, partial [Chitinophagaceae bacterium]|nr:anhydro-N-acetylmuramic acid kinase [Chitinophagaceae bacterium]